MSGVPQEEDVAVESTKQGHDVAPTDKCCLDKKKDRVCRGHVGKPRSHKDLTMAVNVVRVIVIFQLMDQVFPLVK
jgi:hypothetical protein